MATAPEHLNGHRRSTLIVDDLKLACAALSRLLEQKGYDSEFATSGLDALRQRLDDDPQAMQLRRSATQYRFSTIKPSIADTHLP